MRDSNKLWVGEQGVGRRSRESDGALRGNCSRGDERIGFVDLTASHDLRKRFETVGSGRVASAEAREYQAYAET